MVFQNYVTSVESDGITAGYDWGFEIGVDVGKEQACMVKSI